MVVQKDHGRRSRYTVRWLRRLLGEDEHLTIEEAGLAGSALAGSNVGTGGYRNETTAASTRLPSPRIRKDQSVLLGLYEPPDGFDDINCLVIRLGLRTGGVP